MFASPSCAWFRFSDQWFDFSKLDPDHCSGEVIAYYKFDQSLRDVCFGHNAQREKGIVLHTSGIVNNAADFTWRSTYLRVPSLYGYEWGLIFSVSFWFKNKNGNEKIRGLINNGPVNHGPNGLGSWEIRIISNNFITASVVTSQSAKTWKNITNAITDHWHHFAMTYDGSTTSFYHNSHLKLTDSSCHGNILSKNSDVVMGHTGARDYDDVKNEYFTGYLDEVKLFKKALTAQEVTRLYQLKVV